MNIFFKQLQTLLTLHWVRYTAIVLVCIAVVGGVSIFALFSILEYRYSSDLPEISGLETYKLPTLTRLYARNGALIGEYGDSPRVFVPITQIPKRVLQAFLSAEDKNFYHHFGVDILGIFRALSINITEWLKGSGRRPVGASTITQQLAKHFIHSSEITFERKMKEVFLALRIENMWSKNKILEVYLNRIYFGNRAYGIGMAALKYFNKSLKDLSLEEIAYLAALPKGPANYHPLAKKEEAIIRRNWVLHRMYVNGYITSEELHEAQEKPLVVTDQSRQRADTRNYFVEEVRRRLTTLYHQGVLERRGHTVHTTLRPDLQRIADEALQEALIEYDRRQGWAGVVDRIVPPLRDWSKRLQSIPIPKGIEDWRLAMVLSTDDPNHAVIGFTDQTRGHLPLSELWWVTKLRTGEVLRPHVKRVSDVLSPGDVILVEALEDQEILSQVSQVEGEQDVRRYGLRQVPEVQGGLVILNPHNGHVLALSGGFRFSLSEFNRVTQALRQPGSAFKPFVAMSVLENGYNPNTLIKDAPIEVDLGEEDESWRPKNYSQALYDFATLRTSIEQSRNLMIIRFGLAVGIDKIQEVAKRLNIYDNPEPFLSMVLGAQETTVLRLVSGYATLINGGYRVVPTLIERIQEHSGRVIWRYDDRRCLACEGLIWDEELELPKLVDHRERVGDARIVYQVTSFLEGVVQRGTGKALRSLDKPIAGKTGTTNNNQDAWFIGMTPDVVVGVYVGFDQPKSLGDNETGAKTALPAVKKVFEKWFQSHLGVPFRRPANIRLLRINHRTGKIADTNHRDTIWEAFLPGTEFVHQTLKDEELFQQALTTTESPKKGQNLSQTNNDATQTEGVTIGGTQIDDGSRIQDSQNLGQIRSFKTTVPTTLPHQDIGGIY